MALGHKLQMRQTQSLVMTPQLLQSIKLLQLPHAELERFIEEEIERNPLLERVEAAEDGPPAEAGEFENGSGDPSPAEEDWLSPTLGRSSEDISSGFDASLENLFPDDPGRSDRIGPDLAAQWRSAQGSGLNRGESYNLEEVTAATITLRQHVGEQIALTFAEPADRIIAGELADALDEAGYLRGDIAEIAARLEVDMERVSSVLAR
jgi:RNA polymerase sigma-54 factor